MSRGEDIPAAAERGMHQKNVYLASIQNKKRDLRPEC